MLKVVPRLPIAFFALVLLLTIVGMSMPQRALAGGGVGSGGSGGGGTSGGPWGWTTYGHGWASYGINSGGPRAGFHTGSWGNVKSTCAAADARTVMVYILGTGSPPPSNSPTGKYMGYDYTGWSGTWGGGGGVDGGRANKVSTATAHNYYSQLGRYDVDTSGYRWGQNVGWFCWDFQPPQWGKMDATSTANKTTVRVNQKIRWHHKVWDTGSEGNDRTGTISGDVYWGGGTTGPIPGANRYGGGKVDSPKLNYSRKFDKGQDDAAQKNYVFIVPSNAQPGDKYCQYITYKPTAWNNASEGHSSQFCVRVVETPAPADSGAVCTLNLDKHGPIEVTSAGFTATYSATVTSDPDMIAATSDGRTSPPAWGDWGGWSGWSGTDTDQTRQRKRTATTDRVYYRVVKAQFTSDFDGSATTSGRTSPYASGNLSPYSTSYNFPYNPESAADEYTASGEFTYEVEKVVEHYKNTQIQTQDRHREKKKKKKKITYTAWVVGGIHTHSPSGWGLTSTDRSPAGGGTADCGESSIVYAYRPYMDVFGGDIMAGAYQANFGAPGCTTVSSAGINGWNHNRSEVYNGVFRNDYAGAGAEAGAFALANINSFASALKSPVFNANGPPSGLSFANTAGYVTGTRYGGSFGSIPLSCNFAKDLSTATALPNNYGGDTGYSGHTTYKATGNVYISDDVIYADNGGWTTTEDIPRFKLLVTGNIYISGDVTELDGLYVATGNIYTCATGNGAYSSDYDTCHKPLRVYGAFAARKINFLRTRGTLRDATPVDNYSSSHIAETFIYTPELWLPIEPNTGGLKYDSILGLPPVL